METLINKMKLEDVSGGFDCVLMNYGCMRDTIGHFNYEFKSGIYLLEGECATGGWALTTVITGKYKEPEGRIWINDKKIDWKQIAQYSCYVGEEAGLRKNFGLKSMSVQEQIEYGINQGFSFNSDINEIKKLFGLSEERFNRTMKCVSGERWRISMAIGYAMGKTVYCFPWLNNKYLQKLEECLRLCFASLLDIGAIIIIPATNRESIKRISNKYEVIELDY